MRTYVWRVGLAPVADVGFAGDECVEWVRVRIGGLLEEPVEEQAAAAARAWAGLVHRGGGRQLGSRLSPCSKPAAGPATSSEPGTVIVPLEAWRSALHQLGHLHEAGQQYAEAAARAAKAETEVQFLR